MREKNEIIKKKNNKNENTHKIQFVTSEFVTMRVRKFFMDRSRSQEKKKEKNTKNNTTPKKIK